MDKNLKKGLKITGGVLVGVAAVAAVPFTGGGSIFAGAAALGLGTAAAAGSAVIAGAAGGVLAGIFLEDELIVKKGLVILGMQSAGKTTIYDFLQGKKNAGVSTSVDDYKEFKYDFDKNNSILIREGKDIGGGDEFFGPYYNKMINDENIDFCFFVFDSFRYLNNEEERRKVNARLHAIFEKNILNKNTAIIGSYIDYFSKEEQSNVMNKIKMLTEDKSYSSLLSREYLHLIDLTNEAELKKMLNKILSK